jgi:hypothetical protein
VRRLRVPDGDELLFAVVVLVAFLIAALLFGRIVDVLNVCTTSRCPPTETRVELNIVTGLIASAVALVVLSILRTRS